MTLLRTLSLGLTMVLAVSCAPAMGRDVTILEQSAKLLREQALEAEAATIEDVVKRIHDSRLRGEGSFYLGIDVRKALRDYAAKLREIKRDAAAERMESFAKDYEEEQIKAFLRQRGGR